MALSLPQLGLKPGKFPPDCVTETEKEIRNRMGGPENSSSYDDGERRNERDEGKRVIDLRTQSAGSDIGGSGDDGAREGGAGTKGAREGWHRQSGAAEASHGGHGTAPHRTRSSRHRTTTTATATTTTHKSVWCFWHPPSSSTDSCNLGSNVQGRSMQNQRSHPSKTQGLLALIKVLQCMISPN